MTLFNSFSQKNYDNGEERRDNREVLTITESLAGCLKTSTVPAPQQSVVAARHVHGLVHLSYTLLYY